MDITEITKTMSGRNRAEMKKLMNGEDRYSILEMLRSATIENYRTSGELSKIGIELKDAHTRAIYDQYVALDQALITMLTKEGKKDIYDNFSRPDEPDLPDDPSELNNPRIAYIYFLRSLYRRQFDISVNQQKDGGWPLLTIDLLNPIEGTNILLVQQFPEAVSTHNSTDFLKNYSLTHLSNSHVTLLDVKAGLEQRSKKPGSTPEELKRTGELLVWVGAFDNNLETAIEVKKALDKAAEQLEREARLREYKEIWRKEFGNKEPREIHGASDHIDSFDRNRDRISRTA